MHSLIHCVWTGPAFPYRLRAFIKNWIPYLRKSKSDFQLVIWLTKDSYAAISDYLSSGLGNHLDQKCWSKSIKGLNILVNPATISFHKFYIAMAEPLLAGHDPILQQTFNLLHTYKYYTSVSNILRVLVINHCGGIYTDIDYLQPDKTKKFPTNITDIMRPFNFCNSIEFYTPVIDLGHRVLAENQCLILSPMCTGILKTVILEMCKRMTEKIDEIKYETRANLEYLNNIVTRDLARSMFARGKERDLLEAYKQRNYSLYSLVNIDLYKDETHVSFDPSRREQMLDSHGARHRYYTAISKCTYTPIVNYFTQKLRISLKEYHARYWQYFRDIFSKVDMDKQFLFRDNKGKVKGMYNWANPGYSRMSSLEAAVHTVEKYYNPNNITRVNVKLAKRLLEEIKTVFWEKILTARRDLRDSFLGFQSVYEQEFSEKKVMNNNETNYFLKLLFSTLWNCSTPEHNFMTVLAEILNNPTYANFRKIIDPEKAVITSADIEAFIII